MMQLDTIGAQVVPGTSEPLQVLTNPSIIELDDFDPQPRDRCNTWPLQKPTGQHTSPLIHEEIPEEGSIPGSRESLSHTFGYNSSVPTPQTLLPDSPARGGSPTSETMVQSDDSGSGANGVKKNSARRNAWGNMSYADLITQAIVSSPEQRLTLSQVYDWMVQNVPYFRDKGDSNSSAGWKNSIRHNLSLHSRFMRIQNEGAGKSSWWVINPDAKPGKASRRRAATMETKTMEKKRSRVKKKVETLRQAALSQGAEGVQVLSPAISDNSADPYYDGSLPFNPGEFRDRSGSNLSNYSLGGSSNCINRLSPSFEEIMDNPSAWAQSHSEYSNDILDMANIHLGDIDVSPHGRFLSQNTTVTVPDQKPPPPPYQQVMANRFQQPQANGHVLNHSVPVKLEPGLSTVPFQLTTCSQQHHQTQFGVNNQGPMVSQQIVPVSSVGMLRNPIKQELATANAGTCYQELQTTSLSELQSNPMLRDALEKAQHPQHFHGGHGAGAVGNGAPLHQYPGISGQLPSDISDIHYDTYNSSDLQCDIDAVLRHELNVAGKLDFNMDTCGGM